MVAASKLLSGSGCAVFDEDGSGEFFDRRELFDAEELDAEVCGASRDGARTRDAALDGAASST